MNTRLLCFTLLGVLVGSGLIAGTFAHAIQRALTLPPVHRTMQNAPMDGNMPSATPGGGINQGGINQGGINPAPTAAGMATILAQDTFQRNDQGLWGTATDGRVWSGDANTFSVFSVKGASGQIADGQGAFNALLGPVSSNVEVVLRGSMNSFSDSTVNLGVVLRWTDSNNWYKLLINGSSMVLFKRVNGTSTILASLPFPAQDGRLYTLRFRAVGATLFAKAWPSSDSEPTHWMLLATDSALSSGQAGIRVLVRNESVVHIESFLETAVSSGI